MVKKLNNVKTLDPDTILYDVHYACISLVGAFFRIFDVLLTLNAKQTMNDTPERKPYFILPEVPLGRQISILLKDFGHAINDLESSYNNLPQTNTLNKS